MVPAFTEARAPSAVLLEPDGETGREFEVCDPLMTQCLDALPEMIMVLNAAGKVIFHNRAAFQYFGPCLAWALWPEDRRELFHANDIHTRREARETVLRHGVTARGLVRPIRYDYMPRWHTYQLTPLFDARALVTGLMVRMADIHDQHEASGAPAETCGAQRAG